MSDSNFRRLQIVEVSDDSDEDAKPEDAPSTGWRRMDITEASDDDESDRDAGFSKVRIVDVSEDEAEIFPELSVESSKQGVEHAKQQGNSCFAKGALEESVKWFSKGIWLVDSKKVAGVTGDLHSILHSNRAFAYVKLRKWADAEQDCSSALALNEKNMKARYRRALARCEQGKAEAGMHDVDEVLKQIPDPALNKEAAELKKRLTDLLEEQKKSNKEPQGGAGNEWRRLDIVEASDDESEEDVRPGGNTEPDMFPDLVVEKSVAGIEHAKNQGNSLFSQGKLEESVRWFTKGIWLSQPTRVTDVPEALQSILHSNRAFANVKLQRWPVVEEDCSAALAFNSKNTKARYRRAMARFELGKPETAMEDVEQVLKELPDQQSSKEALDLKEKILKQLEKPSEEGWKRLKIVEVSDEESDEDTQPAEAPKKLDEPEILPAIKIEPTKEGIERAKNQGNSLFSKGAVDEAISWFSKCVWLLQSKKVSGVSSDLHSIIHSNRAFAYMKSKQWREAEEDCSAALALNEKNTKARYRRALARFELGRAEPALQDVEQALTELPDPQSKKDAQELKDKIEKQLGAAAGEKAKTTPQPKASAPKETVWRRMEVLPASDDEEEEQEKVDEPKKAPSPLANNGKAEATPKESGSGWRRMQIVEESDDDEPEPAALPKSPSKAAPASPKSAPKEATLPQAASRQEEPAKENESGWRRMQIVEESDDDEPEGPTSAKGSSPTSSQAEILPEIEVEMSRQGIEQAKDKGNALFAKGSVEESIKWFSKGIWLVNNKRVSDVPPNMVSILHSNRAFAFIKLQKWSDAEDDCSAALAVNAQNIKAKYRRAQARFELKKMDDALKDVEDVIAELPDAQSSEAKDLRQKISSELVKDSSPAAPAAGFKRIQVVEDSDSESGGEGAAPDGRAPTQTVEQKATTPVIADPFPSVKAECTVQGIEDLKAQANKLFAQGGVTDSVQVFSKAVWLMETQRVPEVPTSLSTILYSNRAFAYIKLERWAEAEADCSAALGLQATNVKARYRRAMARLELGKAAAALIDVEAVLRELPEAQAKDASSLRDKIRMKLEEQQPQAQSEPATAALQEAKEEAARKATEQKAKEEAARKAAEQKAKEEAARKAAEQKAKEEAARKAAEQKAKEEAARKAAEQKAKEEAARKAAEQKAKEEAARKAAEQTAKEEAARQAAEQKAKEEAAKKAEAQKAKEAPPPPAQGFKRLEIVEASDSEPEEEASNTTVSPGKLPAANQELHPDIVIDSNPVGVESAKNRANQLFAQGSIEESARWLSKCIWLLESNKVPGLPSNIQTILYSNRAFAYIKMSKWSEAEKDCSSALAVSKDNTKATYRRAMARFELGKLQDAFHDIEVVVAALPDPQSNKDALDLKQKIQASIAKQGSDAATKRVSAEVRSETPKTPSPPEQPSTATGTAAGWKRMEIVEASDDESDEQAPPAGASPPSPKDAELFPEIQVEPSRDGIEQAKNKGNAAFAKGSVDDAVKWFSKSLWLVESKRVTSVPVDLQSILYSNRAFAYIRLQRWSEAEEDCSAALERNDKNTKAVYRRAMARLEQGKLEGALTDVERVLKELTDPAQGKEASALKEKIQEKIKQKADAAAPAEPGWKRMQIQEESDEDSGDAASAPQDKAPPQQASQPAQGFKRMQIVEADSDSDVVTHPDSDTEEAVQVPCTEMFPDISIEHSRQGIDTAKNKANSLFSQGSIDESVQWFSKSIWLVESGKVTDVPGELHSILHSNRANAYIKLEKWPEAVQDCSTALALNPKNTKALYRKALAEMEQGRLSLALEAVDKVLQELPADQSKDALALRQKIQERQGRGSAPAEPARASTSSPKGAAAQELAEPVRATSSSSPTAAAAQVKKKAPTPSCDEFNEPFPDIKVEHTVAGIDAAKSKANSFFANGSVAESARWFSKCIWLAEEKIVQGVPSEQLSILRSNRAFAYVKLQKWAEAEEDGSVALSLNSRNTKALYRRALARFELGKLEEALEDTERLLKELPAGPGSREATDLKDQIDRRLAALREAQRLPATGPSAPALKPKGATTRQAPAQAAPVVEAPSSPPASPSSGSTKRVTRAAPVVLGAPSMPSQSPKNSFEMLRAVGSMKRHPDVLARYIKERVPPQLLQGLFVKAPIEPDDLALVLTALRARTAEGSALFSSEDVTDYLSRLWRTRTADTQFAMLSSSEKEVLRGLLDGLPQGAETTRGLLKDFRVLLG